MKTTEDNNRLIAEFMQWDKCTHQKKVTNPKHPQYNKTQPVEHGFSLPRTHAIVDNTYTDCPGYDWDYSKEEEQLIFYYEDLKFNSSYDWLMPVVEKIQKIYPIESKEGEGKQLVYFLNHWLINNHKELTKLEATYKSVVDFIEWWNKEKQQ